MQLGTSKIDITPTEPVSLAGFAHRTGLAHHIQSPVFLKIYLLEHEQQSFLMIVGDLIWWDQKQVEQIKKELEEEYRIPASRVCFHATHNHCGPQTSDQFSKLLGEPSVAYLADLKRKVMISVREAMSNREEVTMEIRKGNEHLGINRRKLVAGVIEMEPNPAAPTDTDLTVITFKTEKNQYKAMWIHYTCHPTSMDENVVSSEFPGVCCEAIEEQYPDCHAAFLQGYCGDIRPDLIKDNQFYRGKITDMSSIGKRLATSVLQVCSAKGEVIEPTFSVKTASIPLDYSGEVPQLESPFPEAKEEWQRLISQNRELELSFQYVQLGDKLEFLTCNAELVHEYGMYLKQARPYLLPLGYSNGMIGYVPTAKQLMEGGYEAEESIFYFGYPSTLSASMEKKIIDQFNTLLGGI